MNRSELERAWRAAEPPPGFPDRVLDRVPRAALSGPPPRRASVRAWLAAHPLRWLALPALALAVAAVFLPWAPRPARDGDVIAAEPRVVSIGERVVAELSSGAHVRWSGDEVEQDSGEVTYRVVPGGRFRVQTPHGSVTVLGTVFRVSVAERDESGGEPMKKRWAIAGASAPLGALLLVSVERGSVLLSKGESELVLRAGQAGSIGADGVPRVESAAPAAAADSQAAERARARQVADAVRRHAARRREAARAASPAPAAPPASKQTPDQDVAFALRGHERAPEQPAPAPLSDEEARRREYIQRTMREQYYPVARDCYQELLGRQPTARGKVVLEFAIVGDGDAGVVDRVELRDDTTFDDPEFTLCMRESMYTAVFEPPPPGANETTVVYPVELTPE